MLVSSCSDGEVRCWDANSFDLLPISLPKFGRVDAIALSADDQVLAVAGIDKNVELWNLSTQSRQENLVGHTGRVWSAEFSPDATQLATASADGTVRVWDVDAHNPAKLTTRASLPYSALAFSSDSERLAVGNVAGEIELWDWKGSQRTRHFRNGEPATSARDLSTNQSGVTAVEFSPDGRQLASADAGGTVRLWDAKTCESQGLLHGQMLRSTSLSFSPDGWQLAVGGMGECARIWDLRTRQCKQANSLLFDALQVLFLPDGQRLAVRMPWNCLEVLNNDRQDRVWKQSISPDVNGFLALSPDGKWLATGGSRLDQAVHLWAADSGVYQGSLVGHTSEVCAIAFCPDDRTLASGGVDGSVRLWDLNSRLELMELESGLERVAWLAFSADGRALAVIAESSEGGLLHVWFTENGNSIDAQNSISTPTNASPSSTTFVEPLLFSEPESERQDSVREFECYQAIRSFVSQQANSQRVLVTFEERCMNGELQYGALVLDKGLDHCRSLEPTEPRHDLQAMIRSINGASMGPEGRVAFLGAAQLNLGLIYWLSFDRETADFRLVPQVEIGPTDDILERFRRVNRWAKSHGYIGGFPTFVDEPQNGQPCYAVALIKPGMAQEVWIPVTRQRP